MSPSHSLDMMCEFGEPHSRNSMLMGRSPKLPRGPVGYCVERSCARRQAPWNMEQLDALAEHHVLWLATNGSQTLQMNKLVQAELSDRFHTLFISQDVGFPKSHPAFVT